MKKITPILIFAFLFFSISNAQNVQKSVLKLKNETNANVTINGDTGLTEFVKFPVGKSMTLTGSSPEKKAFSFLQNYKSIYNIESVEESLILDKVQTDNYGLKHVILKQTYRGVPVFDGELRFHFDASEKLNAINGNFISGINKLEAVPTLSISQAGNIALDIIKGQDLNFSEKPLKINKNTLYVFAKGLVQGHISSHYLVYEVEVRNDSDVREFVFVNAHTGAIVEQFTGMAHALDRRVFEGNTGNLVWQEGDAFPGTLTIWQQNEVEASGHVYNFFNNAFGHISYDGADAQMRTVNNDPTISCPNANWNGSTANYCDGTASDDVIAHEWGHAYTEYTSGLIYAYQSGALNEAYSDIWGETVDLINNYEDAGENLAIRTTTACNSSRWKIGEDATAFGGAIRDMWNPNCNGDPGKVTDRQFQCGENQSAIVHINSGIPNHAYALLVDGGTYNGQTITGLGFTKAAHIFWRAQSFYLTPTSDFANFADALEAACADLVGINLEGLSTTNTPAGPSGQIITAADCQNVTRAILATELRINPDDCGYVPLLAVTPALCEAATSNPLYYEDWESGIGGWTVSQLPTNASTWESRDWNITSSLPDARSGNAMFGPDPINGNCTTNLQNGLLRLQSPVINIPNITTGTFEMAFNHYVATEAQYDGGNLKYKLDAGEWLIVAPVAFLQNPYNDVLVDQGNDNPIRRQAAFTGTDGGSLSGSWGQSVVDLSALNVTANSTIQFRWEMGTDGCNGNDGWYVDEIVIYNCSATLSVADNNYLTAGIRVFPNPSNGIFTLKKVRNIDLIDAEIYDINGRSIKTIDLSAMQNEKMIDITNLTSGVYFMSVSSKDSKSVIKLLRQ